MTSWMKKSIVITLAALTLAACASTKDPYNAPGAQRQRAQDAQSEMRRDTSNQ